MLINKKILKIVIFILTIISFTSTSFSFSIPIDAQQNRLDRLVQDLDKIGSQIGHLGQEEQNLKEEKQKLEKETKDLDKLISEVRLQILQKDKQIEDKRQEIDKVKTKLRLVLLEYHQQKLLGNFQFLITSKNIGELSQKLSILDRTQKKISDLSMQLNSQEDKLKQQQAKNQDTKNLLENSKLLLKSKRDSIEYITLKTENKQQNYEALLEALKQQEKEIKTEVFLNDFKQKSYLEVNESTFHGEKCVRVEEKVLYIPANFFIRPAKGWTSQGFNCFHDAIDIANGMGTHIIASAKGQVFLKDYMPGGYGNYIVLEHTLPSNQKIYSLYAHLQEASFREKGEVVDQGEVVGYMGCTGNTRPRPCGVHLHFAIISDTNQGQGYIGCLWHAKRKCLNPKNFF